MRHIQTRFIGISEKVSFPIFAHRGVLEAIESLKADYPNVTSVKVNNETGSIHLSGKGFGTVRFTGLDTDVRIEKCKSGYGCEIEYIKPDMYNFDKKQVYRRVAEFVLRAANYR